MESIQLQHTASTRTLEEVNHFAAEKQLFEVFEHDGGGLVGRFVGIDWARSEDDAITRVTGYVNSDDLIDYIAITRGGAL